jgi:hypothetical protein
MTVLQCPNCGNYAQFELHHRRVWFTLFWVPVFPYQSDFFLACDMCSRGVFLTREQVEKLRRESSHLVASAAAQVTGETKTALAPGNAGAPGPATHPIPELPPRVPRSVWIGGGIVAALIVLVAISTKGFSTTTTQPPDPEITAHNAQFVSATSAEATGTVVNKGGETAQSVVVNFYVEDGGTRVAIGQQTLGDIGPGSSMTYDITVSVPNGQYIANPIAAIEWGWQAAECPQGTVPSPNPTASGNFCLHVMPSQ